MIHLLLTFIISVNTMFTRLIIRAWNNKLRPNKFLIELQKDGVSYYQKTNGKFAIRKKKVTDIQSLQKSGLKNFSYINKFGVLTPVTSSTLLVLMDATKRFDIYTNINDFPENMFMEILKKMVTNKCIESFNYPQHLGSDIEHKRLITKIFENNRVLRRIYCYNGVIANEHDIAPLYWKSQIRAEIIYLRIAVYKWWLKMVNDIVNNSALIFNEDHMHCVEQVLQHKSSECGISDIDKKILDLQKNHGVFLQQWSVSATKCMSSQELVLKLQTGSEQPI
jgi:hypothetical protein